MNETSRSARDPSGTGRNLEPFLLLELLRGPSYGYDLIKRLGDYGFRRSNEPAVVYRVLRALEDAGYIQSEWATRESGPARRNYEITDEGRKALRLRAYHLNRQRERIERLLHEYTMITKEDPRTDPRVEEALVEAAATEAPAL